jgi:hypothetical protein
MHKFLIVPLLALVCLAGCKKPATPSAVMKPADVLEEHLRQMAGAGATNCGRVAPGGDVKPASNCAMQANTAKRPFYVGYDLPGGDLGTLTFAFAGNTNGNVYRVEYSPKTWQGQMPGGDLSADKRVFTVACSEPLRVAQSGRVTCAPPLGMAGGMNPHGGLMTAPGMANPHGGMTMPPH